MSSTKPRPQGHPPELDLPFFDEGHRHLKRSLHEWCLAHIGGSEGEHIDDVDAQCGHWVKALGRGDWLRFAVAGLEYGGDQNVIDTRSICLLREELAWHHGLVDFAFAMQGLGSGAISLFGSEEQKEHYLPRVADGSAVAAFALSEPHSGSDVAAMSTTATLKGDHFEINGSKTWISNGGIANFYVVFARTNEAPGARGISAFIVDAKTPGLEISERIDVIAPHPLATLRFVNMRVPVGHLLGESGQGFKVAMATLDVFRTSVAAAALGFARRALDASIGWVRTRHMFGQALGDFQITQTKIAEMATLLDAATLLTYRAAWMRDQGHRITREAAMAKMTATENAQKIIDMAVQLHGGMGVKKGCIVESLYREIRALRIYEGATEVQLLIIGRDLIKP